VFDRRATPLAVPSSSRIGRVISRQILRRLASLIRAKCALTVCGVTPAARANSEAVKIH
ncbi:MAG: hypothetical protein ACI8PT_002013, partial [Gammaproteobacteria bacterium]